ncbi:glycosyl transferase [Mergibacter septicus]|uniref:Glycosyl transferase n=1 Tax=Mergibacter septicus TaxID=221402 RepID=A0A8D4IZL5_9PAST|nr:sugar transferase [Mergibacter septicus]AWX15117.1 glycosyl transferase [Mergibacter septicus]QDJ14370.1 glycosyl transferase [Mergibacter septicus]UTU48190.1 sugar transferase [Mergibacter septicus]WMR96191.1 sugar transferase [Mergibacter septicus]
MNSTQFIINKRHYRWYEQLCISWIIQVILAIGIIDIIPAIILWGKESILQPNEPQLNSIIIVGIILLSIILTLRVLTRYPGNKSASFILSSIGGLYSVGLFILWGLRIQYSVYLISFSFVLTLLFCFLGYFLLKRLIIPKIAYIPLGDIEELIKIKNIIWVRLDDQFTNHSINIDAVAVDLYSPNLTVEWQKFLAFCTLNSIPVYNSAQLRESLTGRVRIRHIYENNLGQLLPSPFYFFIKRLIDIILVLISLPFVIPVMVLTAILIKLESKGDILFTQKRVGQKGKEFTIFKFRSMCMDSEKLGAKLADVNDVRITRIGRFIRKTRIDELPQFFNVLKGDMSLIGPRPEQLVFVQQFEKEIPFYSYRHIVKPGISGWAQVMQGYAGNTEDTKLKIEYDLYYIKNFSLWLDILIVFKTIKTMLTGFGSR